MMKKGVGWGWIVFWLIFFWPIGLYLLVKKFSTDKSALMSGRTGALSVVGWILVVFGATGFLVEITGTRDASGFVIALMFFVGGVLLLRKASNTKKTAARYKKYIDIVVNQNVRSIDHVAAALGLSYDAVVHDLQDMINRGYLKDAYVHQGNREIILKHIEPQPSIQEMIIGQSPAQTKAMRCPGCGANNIGIAGKVSECEYCGTPING